VLPTARGVALTAEDRLRGAVIAQLMCALEVDLVALAGVHEADPAALLAAGPELAAQAADGLVRWDGRRISITELGKPFVRAVAALFDPYFRAGTARHAATV